VIDNVTIATGGIYRTMARLPLVVDAQDKRIVDIFQGLQERGNPVGNVYRTLAYSPPLTQAWHGFLSALRDEVTSPRGLRELVIMRVAQLTNATYIWSRHWPMAIASGVRPAQLEDLRDWEVSSEFSEEERAALRYAQAITEMRDDEAGFDSLRARFSPEVIVELTLTASFYTTVAQVTQALQIDLEPEYLQYAKHLSD
jgi:alkylhydroperoxidase family enzyme